MNREKGTSVWAIFTQFFILGCTSFGGPVAHIGFFRKRFVDELNWINDKAFSDLLSLCQFIPGPASSQLGMALGYHRHSYAGAIAAWLAFTLPSALLLTIFAALLVNDSSFLNSGVLQGLKLVAVAVVIQAFVTMRHTLTPDFIRILVMVVSALAFALWNSVYAPIFVLSIVGLLSSRYKVTDAASDVAVNYELSRVHLIGPIVCLSAFFVLLAAALLVSRGGSWESLSQASAYYNAGSLVFGGGHVVLPLLESQVVTAGWVDKDIFLAGYGAAQAVPGPLFTFASFLGASHLSGPNGFSGAALATFAIFLPSFLLLFGVLPFWDRLRSRPKIKSALWGVNAAVLGLLLATLYDPVITQSIKDLTDIAFVTITYIALVVFRLPVVAIVIAGGALGAALF
ncbi:MAG: chromate efflux transporter [Oleiphilaceae bacterium]|nr:chromate efflux transporter [Oleiphilaceae bacterium]